MQTHLFLLAGQHPGMSHAAALHAATRYTLAAERAGYAGVWLAEHHFIPYGVCPSAVTFAAHLLGRTERITVGTAAAILSNRHPVALGEETALLHEVTGGRFHLGVARGGPWVDLEVFGTGLDRYEHGFAEALDLLLDWLSGREQVGADGERFRFRPVAVVPRPTRTPPVWIAATSTDTVEHAARRGQPLLLGMHTTDAETAALVEHYTRTAVRHGHDPSHVPHASVRLAHVGDTDDDAATAVRRHLPGLLAGTSRYVRVDASQPTNRDLDAYTEHLIGVGVCSECDRT